MDWKMGKWDNDRVLGLRRVGGGGGGGGGGVQSEVQLVTETVQFPEPRKLYGEGLHSTAEFGARP